MIAAGSQRCGIELLACADFAMFVAAESEKRWRAASRAPSRARYETLLGDAPHERRGGPRKRTLSDPHAPADPAAREKAVRDLFEAIEEGPPLELPEHSPEQ